MQQRAVLAHALLLLLHIVLLLATPTNADDSPRRHRLLHHPRRRAESLTSVIKSPVLRRAIDKDNTPQILLLLLDPLDFYPSVKNVQLSLEEEEKRNTFTKNRNRYSEEIRLAGGNPVVVTWRTTSVDELYELIDRSDGVLFGGGEDIDPARYFEKTMEPGARGINTRRDDFEFAALNYIFQKLKPALEKEDLELEDPKKMTEALIKEKPEVSKESDLSIRRLQELHRAKIPVMGICRGHQLLNVFLGGKLIQHLGERHRPSQNDPGPTHKLYIVPNTYLARVLLAAPEKEKLDSGTEEQQPQNEKVQFGVVSVEEEVEEEEEGELDVVIEPIGTKLEMELGALEDEDEVGQQQKEMLSLDSSALGGGSKGKKKKTDQLVPVDPRTKRFFTITVNSYHHQAVLVDTLSPLLSPAAYSRSGGAPGEWEGWLVEGYEAKNLEERFLVGVQFHPERGTLPGTSPSTGTAAEASRSLFHAFVSAAKLRVLDRVRTGGWTTPSSPVLASSKPLSSKKSVSDLIQIFNPTTYVDPD